MTPQTQKLLIFIIATSFCITGFCISFLYFESVYALSQKVVLCLQQQIRSRAFITFMNIVSNIFNPTVCAGYVLILYVLTARKLEVIAFLLWFLFLSWTISIMKQLFQQPRPFWVNPDIQMLEWTCYTEYGSPSGHSALVIVLLDFFVRFGCRWRQSFKQYQILWYSLVFITQLTVMFSRMFLGAHSLNQVLFGCMLGAYSLVPYYLYIQKILFTFCIKFLTQGKKVLNIIAMIIIMLLLALQQLFLAFIPKYIPQNSSSNPWIQTIMSHPACKSYNYQTSFYLRCLEDSSIAFGIPAMMMSLSITHNGYSLLKKLSYPRMSWKFLAYLMTVIIVALIPVSIFMNPHWKKVQMKDKALLLWAFNSLGFIFGILSLVVVSAYFLKFFGLDHYEFQSYYNQYRIVTQQPDGKKHIQMVNIETPNSNQNNFPNL